MNLLLGGMWVIFSVLAQQILQIFQSPNESSNELHEQLKDVIDVISDPLNTDGLAMLDLLLGYLVGEIYPAFLSLIDSFRAWKPAILLP